MVLADAAAAAAVAPSAVLTRLLSACGCHVYSRAAGKTVIARKPELMANSISVKANGKVSAR